MLRAYAELLRWLGPWTAGDAVPEGIARRELQIPFEPPFRAWLYEPKAPVGDYLVAPGLHYLGPADPRLDRFCKILARAGFRVLAPFLPSYLGLEVRPRVIDELGAAFDRFEPSCANKPGVFSISFGSLPAIHLARDPRVGALVCFGGYGDFAATIRFCLGLDGHLRRDPLNQPVVFLNVVDAPPEVAAAWRAFVEATWGRPELKEPARYVPIAERIGADLGGEARELYRAGVGLAPDAFARVASALARKTEPYLDPRPLLAAIRCPVSFIHGADDDVIPPSQLDVLSSALPSAEALLTGLYGHTGSTARLAGAVREVGTLARVLRAMVRGGVQRRP